MHKSWCECSLAAMHCWPPAVPSQSRCLRVLQQFPPPESPGERKSLQDVLQVIINFSEWDFEQ